MVTCDKVGFHSLSDYGRFSVVIWLWDTWDHANLFWLKVLVLPLSMRNLKGLACTSRLWGRFEILYHLCECGFVFGNLGFVMVLYSALFAW